MRTYWIEIETKEDAKAMVEGIGRMFQALGDNFKCRFQMHPKPGFMGSYELIRKEQLAVFRELAEAVEKVRYEDY